MFSHFSTLLQICGNIATGRSEAVHMTIRKYYCYNFRFQRLCQRIVSAYHCIPCCNSHVQESMFSQIVLLQYKAKPYLLGFQNLGCHCKILGCHFDTQKRLKNTLLSTTPAHNVFCYSSVAHILTPSVNLAFGPKSGFKNECRAPAGFALNSGFKMRPFCNSVCVCMQGATRRE